MRRVFDLFKEWYTMPGGLLLGIIVGVSVCLGLLGFVGHGFMGLIGVI